MALTGNPTIDAGYHKNVFVVWPSGNIPRGGIRVARCVALMDHKLGFVGRKGFTASDVALTVARSVARSNIAERGPLGIDSLGVIRNKLLTGAPIEGIIYT